MASPARTRARGQVRGWGGRGESSVYHLLTNGKSRRGAPGQPATHGRPTAGRQVSTRMRAMCPLFGWMCPVFGQMCPVCGQMCPLDGRMCPVLPATCSPPETAGDGRWGGQHHAGGPPRTGKCSPGSGPCVHFSAECVQFAPKCVHPMAECVQFAGDVFTGRARRRQQGREDWASTRGAPTGQGLGRY